MSSLERAQTLLESGNPDKATELYQAWLEVNRGDPEYTAVLKKLIGIQDSAAEILDLLTVYSPGIEQAAERTAFTRMRISLLQMLGRIEEALQLSKTVPKTASAAYAGALLFYELGCLSEAEAELHLILRQPERVKAEVMARSNYLLARIQAARGRRQEAEALYLLLLKRYGDSEVLAAVLLGYIELLMEKEQAEEAAELLATLQERFPDSPEYYLARGLLGKSPEQTGEPRIAFIPSPDRLLPGLENREPQRLEMGIDQAGSGGPGTGKPDTGKPGVGPADAERADSMQPGGREANAGQPGATQLDAAQPQPTTEERVVVQTGSFRDRDNAFYMVKDLEYRGFEASILEVEIKEDTYFRVVVGWHRIAEGRSTTGVAQDAAQRSTTEAALGGTPSATQGTGLSPDAAQQLLIRLKEAGFKGVLLFLEHD